MAATSAIFLGLHRRPKQVWMAGLWQVSRWIMQGLVRMGAHPGRQTI